VAALPATRILHAIHDFLPRHRAGAEIYAAALCQALRRRHHHVTVLTSDYDLTCAHGNLRWRAHDGLPLVEIVNNWEGSFTDTYQSALLNRRLEQILDVVRPHLLHVHSLLNLSFDLPALAKRRGIAVVGTLHDYTLVCAAGGQRVHQAEEHLCREIDPARCARCVSESVFQTKLAVGAAAGPLGSIARRAAGTLKRVPAVASMAARAATVVAPLLQPADIERRLNAARSAMDAVSLFVSPSRSVAEEYGRLGIPPERLCVSDYGFVAQPLAPRQPRSDRRLRAAYVGTLVWHKGVHVMLEALRHLPPDAIDVAIFGDPAVSPEYVATLRRQAHGLPVRFAGPFTEPERSAVMAALDVIVVPSLWLENSPLVIHEAFMAGVPVIASRIGGIGELVEDRVNGLLVAPGSPEDLAAALRTCLEDSELLAQLSARAPSVKTIEQDAEEWELRYRDALAREERTRSSSAAPVV
jgi:glycosyltransferase involved in cell wall biosynthesis